MAGNDTDKRLRELEKIATQAETAVYLSKWLIAGLCISLALILARISYVLLGKKIEDIGNAFLDQKFGVALSPFIKNVRDVDDAIKKSANFVFLGEVESFDSKKYGGCDGPKSDDSPKRTICWAWCPNDEEWVILSGQCNIEGSGEGKTGYLQNMGARFDEPNIEFHDKRHSWYCTSRFSDQMANFSTRTQNIQWPL